MISRARVIIKRVILTCLIGLVLASCLPENKAKIIGEENTLPWKYADLRTLREPAGEAPALSLTGLYSRYVGDDLQIRLDVLDMQSADEDADLYLALGGRVGVSLQVPQGANEPSVWDLLIVARNGGSVRTFSADGFPLAELSPRIERDPVLDTVVISLRAVSFLRRGAPVKVEALLAAPGSYTPSSRIGPVSLQESPLVRAPLLLEFWNTLPAASPAQALRRWDGAHTGPLGQRHGLSPLLALSEKFNIPLVLLDLKKPASLSALDALGGLNRVKDLYQRGLLVLPDLAWGDPQAAQTSLDTSRKAAASFGLPSSPFLFGAWDGPIPTRYRVVFAEMGGSQRILRHGAQMLIPLPGKVQAWREPNGADPQATLDGPSLAVRKALLAAALNKDKSTLVVLGGDLPRSNWGDARAGATTLGWLADHPWVWPLGQADLLGWPARAEKTVPVCSDLLCLEPLTNTGLMTRQGVTYPDGLTSAGLRSKIRTALNGARPGRIRDLAWEAYFSLTDPLAEPALQELRSNTLGQIGALLAASRWATNPGKMSDCSHDLDWDGLAECVWSSDSFFGVFETDGARLSLAFIRTPEGPAQVIGQTSQFAVGLSDPSTWQPDRGPAGDPGEIPGAFGNQGGERSLHLAEAYPDHLVFTRPGHSTTFTFSHSGLRVIYQGEGPYTIRIPLTLGAAERYHPGWVNQYGTSKEEQSWMWGWETQSVEITTRGALSVQTFLDESAALSLPENPNKGYLPGHLLPFPIALVKVSALEAFSIDMKFKVVP